MITQNTAARRTLPAALQAQIVQHPWAKTSVSRDRDQRIAAAAANSSAARAAALQLTRDIWQATQRLSPQVSRRELFASFAGYDAAAGEPRFWASGDIHPNDVEEALTHGNLRELMTLALNASYHLEQQLTPAGKRGVFTAPPQSLAADSARMRRERTRPRRGSSEYETASKLGTPQDPPLSPREIKHLRTYLEAQPYTSDVNCTRLPTQLGKHRWVPRYDHPFMAHAVARGLHVTAGVSGMTHRLMALQQCLAGARNLQALRLACVGYFTPHHHALHEVLTAAAHFGCE